MEKTSKFKKFIVSKTATLIGLLIVIIAFFAIMTFKNGTSTYLTVINLKNVLNMMVLYMLFAVGSGLLIIAGNIDLSPGYIGTMCGVFLAFMLANTSLPSIIVILLALLLGVVIGLLNGLLINALGFQSFIATLATGSFIARGLTYVIANGKTVPIKDPIVLFIGTKNILEIGKLDIPVALIISLLVILIYGIILSKTAFGRSIYLCGGNMQAARLAGLNPTRLSYILFANSGFIGALAGIILAGRLKSGNMNGTNAYAFPAITAAILGGISFGGGSGGMLGCFIGLLVINSFTNGLTVMQVNPYFRDVASGLLLLLALTFDYFSAKRSVKAKTPKAVKA
jgi:ribose/xylose/arabinose/galactoside ABC-type transport system permease subunit